jgi:hypothetical protein
MGRFFRAVLLLAAMACIAVGVANADVAVTFPSNNSFDCNINGCDFMGNNGGQTAPFFTSGDFVTEIFATGQTTISGLSYDFFLIDDFGGNAGAQYQNNIYINNTLVGSFLVPDCNFCQTHMEFSGSLNFGTLEGDGTYALSIVLGQSAPAGDGNEIFVAPGSATLISNAGTTPEPGTLVLMGSGVLGLAGWARRRSLF